jgi:predicted SAM-dependent methyltransferase
VSVFVHESTAYYGWRVLCTLWPMSAADSTTPGSLKLHLGCGDIFVPGWENIDKTPNVLLSRVPAAKRALARLGVITRGHVDTTFPKGIIFADILKGLPYPDRSARYVYHAHLIEHLSHDQGRMLVQECARLLAPGGVMRIATPNLADYIDAYNRGNSQNGETQTRADVFMRSIGTYEERPGTTAQRFLRRNFGATFHQWLYDPDSLAHLLRGAGFTTTVTCSFREGGVPDLDQLEMRREGMFIEAARDSAA